jgi:HK97 family phage portal protein
MIHVRQRMIDGFWGYSTLRAGGRTLSLGQDIDQFQRDQFSSDPSTRGVFVRDSDKGQMTDEVYRRTKQQLQKLLNRRASGEPLVLEDGIEYKEFTFKADEADMVKALDKHVEAICKLWRMPPHKAMHLTAVKYENLAAMENVYVRDTLIPLCKLIEARLGKMLLTREERLRYRFEFNRDDLTVADEEQLRKWVTEMLDRSSITINEARQEAGWNPEKWGDARLVPANGVIIDEDNNVVAAGSAAASGKLTPQSPTAPADDSTAPAATEESARGLRLVSGR